MNLQQTKETVITLLKHAGEQLKKDYHSEGISVESKGGLDFLTAADKRTDEFLRQELKKHFPDTQFLTEETSDGNFLPLREKDNVWVIDPIDGTTNFFRKSPHFSISVALVSKGKPMLGVVYLPLEDKLYTADAETPGAFLNDDPISSSKTSQLSKATIAFDWSWDLTQRKRTYERVGNVITSIRQMLTLGCASSDMCQVAEGKMDGYFLYGIKPWDIAASSLILEKAGGKITKIDGSEWNVYDPEFLASNGILHADLVKLLS